MVDSPAFPWGSPGGTWLWTLCSAGLFACSARVVAWNISGVKQADMGERWVNIRQYIYIYIYIYVTTVTTSYDIWSTFMYDLANCFGKYEKHFGLRWVGNPGSTLLRNFNQDIGSRTWEFQNGRTFEGCRSFGGFSQRHIMTTRYYTYNLNSNNNSNHHHHHHHHHHHDHPPHHHFLLLLHLNPSRLGAKK